MSDELLPGQCPPDYDPAENLNDEITATVLVAHRVWLPPGSDWVGLPPDELARVVGEHRRQLLSELAHQATCRLHNAADSFLWSVPQHMEPTAMALVEAIEEWASVPVDKLFDLDGVRFASVDEALDESLQWRESANRFYRQVRWLAILTAKAENRRLAPPKDGPLPPDEFCWNGRREHMGGKSFHLVQLLWSREGRRISVDDAYSTIWGEGKEGDAAFKSAQNRANQVFLALDCPLSLRRKNGYVYLDG